MTFEPHWQETEDWHTEGEPFRIVQKLPTDSLDLNLTVSDQRLRILSTPNHPLDRLRQSLCHEPRGHADMYGGFVTPPNDQAAHFGVLFWHRDGFSTACGHGTIALGYWAIANALVKAPENGDVDVVIDVPSGRVTARAHRENGKTAYIDFVNVPSYQVAKAIPATVQLYRKTIPLEMDLTFGGALLACVDVADLGLAVEPANHQSFIDIQRQIKRQHVKYRYQEQYEIFGVCFFAKMDSSSEDTVIQKNVLVFADGQIDRSPCGSGTAARVAVLLAQGKLSSSKTLKHHSIIDTVFEAGVGTTTLSPTAFPACIPWIRGTARLVGNMNFYIDPSDPVYPGFLLR
ncbi:Diaminopimelate epimerase-like protein [Hortaea werneckii]|uniref:trans-L-3-hydroxyproline dehydratase n=1 Tax=Hortaea werneckii TaxID=91943 RepID=A0A3M7G777_HORWE|nr:Diaminopimelate epimerase-like protein [Hortaea werneckii]KAI7572187.1 Diaminopimelate epimerase-like protein [Hortaea werneckii]KAI7627230.1 Diaminopimelate epimerase-like protein [Hortaea werneckii]KAI7637815.1 Diaminopimelate epimerase-like protein [Hortaea werneckii]KAI7682595.1 Diaminopimelate epimerase-like protein [Hortaea werneckii]